jgi:iron-regulated transporter 1
MVTTITVNRSAIIIACLCWFLIVGNSAQNSFLDGGAKTLVFLVILLFGVVESLSRKTNVLSIERDWVPVLSPQVLAETSSQYDLAHVNAMMSRIDICCKLVAPIAVSGFSSVVSPRTSVATTALVNLISFPLEFWTAQKV